MDAVLNTNVVSYLLSLGKLRCTTRSLESVLLSFLHSGVTSEEACLLEKGLVVLVSGKESTSNAVTDSACLAGEAAAAYVNNYVELANGVGNTEGLIYNVLHGLKTEVLIDTSAVDGNNTGTGIETNSGYGLLSSACAVEIGLCTSIHYTFPPLSVNYDRLLSSLLVRCICINVQTGEGLSTDGVVGKHSLNSKLHSLLGTGSHKGLVLDLLEAADVTGMVTVVLLLKLLTGENCLGSVYDDNVLAAVSVGGELRSVLAAKNFCSLNSGLAEGLACCVDYKPSAFNVVCVSHECRHFDFLRFFGFRGLHGHFSKLVYYSIYFHRCQHFFGKNFEKFDLKNESSRKLLKAPESSRILHREK